MEQSERWGLLLGVSGQGGEALNEAQDGPEEEIELALGLGLGPQG